MYYLYHLIIITYIYLYCCQQCGMCTGDTYLTKKGIELPDWQETGMRSLVTLAGMSSTTSFSTLLTSTWEPSYLWHLWHLQSPWRFNPRVIASPTPQFSPLESEAPSSDIALGTTCEAKPDKLQLTNKWLKHNTNDVKKNKPHLWQLKFVFATKRYMKIQAMFWIILQASTSPQSNPSV